MPTMHVLHGTFTKRFGLQRKHFNPDYDAVVSFIHSSCNLLQIYPVNYKLQLTTNVSS